MRCSPGGWAAFGLIFLFVCSLAVIAVVMKVSDEEEAAVPREGKGLAWWEETVIYHVYTPSFFDSDADGYGDIKGRTGRGKGLSSMRYFLPVPILMLS